MIKKTLRTLTILLTILTFQCSGTSRFIAENSPKVIESDNSCKCFQGTRDYVKRMIAPGSKFRSKAAIAVVGASVIGYYKNDIVNIGKDVVNSVTTFAEASVDLMLIVIIINLLSKAVHDGAK